MCALREGNVKNHKTEYHSMKLKINQYLLTIALDMQKNLFSKELTTIVIMCGAH